MLAVSTKFVRCGHDVAMLGSMLRMRFLASSNVRSRGEAGKLPSTLMLLSVKSMASCAYAMQVVSG